MSIVSNLRELVTEYPAIVRGLVSVLVVVAAKFGFDLPAEAAGLIVSALVVTFLGVHVRVSPVPKAERGLRRRRPAGGRLSGLS